LRAQAASALTNAGSMLLRYAEQIFSLANAADWELRELAGLPAGHVKIGASAPVGVYLVPEMIVQFNAIHPQVAIDLTVANTGQVEAGLHDHAFALGLIEGPFDHTILHSRPIGADEIVAVAAARHPRAGQKLSAAHLSAHAVILREPGSGTRVVVEEAYGHIDLQIDPLMSVSDTEAIKRILLAQHTIAYVSLLSMKDELRRGELTVLEADDLRIERALHMIWLKGLSLSPSTQLFSN
jgi:DNA-binding transcriptional LysR family regulator